MVRVPAVPLPGYPGFRLGLPGRRVRAALIRHRAELVHLASPVVLGAHGAAVARRLGLPTVAVYQTDLPSYARAYRFGRAGEALAEARRAARGGRRVRWRVPLARRMRALNAAGRAVTRRSTGPVHLDAARDPATYERRYWSVDRLHPNERGHRLVACRFHALLAAADFPVGPGPDPSRPARRRPGWPRWAGWRPRARRGWSGGPATWCRPWWAWRCANGSASAAKSRNATEPEITEPKYPEPESTGLARVNLNVLSKPSGNLQLHECLPSARLKVRNRFSKRNEKT